MATPSKDPLTWKESDQAQEDSDNVIEIEEETDDDVTKHSSNNLSAATPQKSRIWKNSGSRSSSRSDDDVTPTFTPNKNVPSKPRQSNISLLSSTVAYATLERCLLGHLATMREEMGEPSSEAEVAENNNKDTTVDGGDDSVKVIDYSKQCKPGHVIDLLELRRLSSRGVPDEPHELRSPASPLHRKTIDANNKINAIVSSDNNINYHHTTHFGGSNPHRSYRPLVWRVLLGYLPPQTDQWNEVLTRDRKLYATLVNELFESTCPSPHEVYTEQEKQQQQQQEQSEMSTDNNNNTDNDNDMPPPPPSLSPTNSKKHHPMPGLLSARMQQEWVRNDEDKNNNDNLNNNRGRISPLCAMNTPRSRSKKMVVSLPSLPDDLEGDSPSLTNPDNDDAGDQLAGKMKESLLLPSANNDNGETTKFTIDDDDDDEEDGDVEDTATKDTEETSDTEEQQHPTPIDKNKIAKSVSIAKTTGDEGIEAHIPLTPHESEANEIAATSTTDEEEENLLLLDEIRKDVIRTHPDLRFFLEPKEDLGQKRYAALERILFVWAKLNKGVRYVQGMNEIVGTLYFVLAQDANDEWAKEAEADTYFLFNSILVEMRDVFVPDLDEADTGIHGRISNMINLLSLHDPEVRCHLDSVGIDPSFYSVRWLTTLLSREFLLPDTIRLWDSMFASTHKDNFLRYVSVTMVMVIRDQLLEGDFSACLRLLQAYPPTNLDKLLESSRALWIYESQITLACHKGGISLGHALRSINPPPSIVMAYGLHGGVAPQIGEQVREAGHRGLAAARDGANVASSTVANAGRSFFGNAMSFWRSGSQTDDQKRGGDLRRSKTSL